jgi:hypothetical protein
MVMQIVRAILPARRGRAVRVEIWVAGPRQPAHFLVRRVHGPDRTGSAKGMEHEFTIPARVVEVTEAPQEIDPDTGELLPQAPATTDDGTPISAPAKPDDDRSR